MSRKGSGARNGSGISKILVPEKVLVGPHFRRIKLQIVEDTQASSCRASGNANVQGEEYLPVQPVWQSGDWPTQDTQASSCPVSGNANAQGEEYLPVQPTWQSGDWPTQDTQASSCPASGNANVQGKGAYSIQATLQNIEDWSTQVSSYSAPKDANHQSQNSHAPFHRKEDLTPQLIQL
jgi:hypothetical protein